MCANVNDFYLNKIMERYKYTRLPISTILQEIIDQYDLMLLVHNDHVYTDTRKCMYGLPQARRIANDQLTENLAKNVYKPTRLTTKILRHETHTITLSLDVDNFGRKMSASSMHTISSVRYNTSTGLN